MLKHAGEAHSFKVEKILFQGKSDYQNVIVFQVQLLLEKESLEFVCFIFFNITKCIYIVSD